MATKGRASRRRRDPRFFTSLVLPLVAAMVGLVTLGHVLSRHGAKPGARGHASGIARAWLPAGPPVTLAREQLQPAGRARDGRTLWQRSATGGGGGGSVRYEQVAPGRYQPIRASESGLGGDSREKAPGTAVPGASERR